MSARIASQPPAPARIDLPGAPDAEAAILAEGGAAGWAQPVSILTYEPGPASPHPMFFDRRVYQGSSGRVYPLPFVESVATESAPRDWQAVHLENRWLRVMVLPELGGRIHIGYDKVAGYDFLYRNNVIKPALVGLAGPWIAGGIEFNWPQHHRPGTYSAVDWEIERSDDGAVTVWCTDHEPFERMRATHGVRLRPDRAAIELVVRLHNRTDLPQTFLWWANVAAPVHAGYQSFFPPDVRYVADHARRAIVAFPRADRDYYGVDYARRVTSEHPDADRLDFAANIPVPTSYMVVDSKGDFFGGYDHVAGAGFVHVADHRIAPGKKQWTWGNDRFGDAWHDILTDADGPYLELMAGVFTDNQPDFSYLAPGEVREFEQCWYPIQAIGPVHQANADAAVSVSVEADGRVQVGVAAVRELGRCTVRLRAAESGVVVGEWEARLAPGLPFQVVSAADSTIRRVVLEVVRDGAVVIEYRSPGDVESGEPAVAVEPPAPELIDSVDELFLTGVHLQQYRHPTRSPLPYWTEALLRDPGHLGTNTAMAALRYRRGEYDLAEVHARAAVARATLCNPNPADGEPFYLLGLVLERAGRLEDAYDAFAKAAWDGRQAHGAAIRAASLDLRAGRHDAALERLTVAERSGSSDPRVAALRVIALRAGGRASSAETVLRAARVADPHDQLLRALDGAPLSADGRTISDVACELARVGERAAAIALLDRATVADPTREAIHAYLAASWSDDPASAGALRKRARRAGSTGGFPAGLDEYDALVAAKHADETDPVARAMLGMLLYDAGRVSDALRQLETSVALAACPVASTLRNLALARMRVHADVDGAAAALEAALAAAPGDARLLYELDQLSAVRCRPVAERLALLDGHLRMVGSRDDLSVAHVNLLTLAGRVDEALVGITARRFRPWEGGEGRALDAHSRARLAQARRALADGEPRRAVEAMRAALEPPRSLGETFHPATNRAPLLLVLGDAYAADGQDEAARRAWRAAGDELAGIGSTSPDDEAAWASSRALERLGESAQHVTDAIRRAIEDLRATPPQVDYFATSLPDLLLFPSDPDVARTRRITRLEACVAASPEAAIGALDELLESDPGDLLAFDLRAAMTHEMQRVPAA